MFAVPVDALANQSSVQNACDDINLQIIQCEVQDTLHKRDQFLSEECAWRALLGSTTLSELEDIKLDLDEKLQASEQDLLDSSEGAAKNAHHSDERWDTRYEELQAQEASNAHMLAKCRGLKQEAKSMACTLEYDTKTEKELKASRQSLLAALARSPPAVQGEELPRSRRALQKLATARRACDISQRDAAEAEAALQRARCERSSEAAPMKASNAKAANAKGLPAPLSIVQDPKAAFWSGLCKKSKAHAKASQNKAERAAQRYDQAEKKAEQSLEAVRAFMPAVDLMVTEVQNAKRDLDLADRQQRIVGAVMLVAVLVNLIKLLGGSLPLVLLHDAPAFICFATGIIVMGFVRVLVPALREHVHSSVKVPFKSSSEGKLAMAGSVKFAKL